MKKAKRAIVLSGGGPPVGLQVGALKALDEHGIDFEVFTANCIGSWTACIYNSHKKTKRFEKLKSFYDACFMPDDIFDGFSVPVDIFVVDYFQGIKSVFEKLSDHRSYEGLFLPDRVMDYMNFYLNPINYPKNTVDLSLLWTKAMSLNPSVRLFFKLIYHNNTTGRSGLLGPGDFGKEFVEEYIDFEKLMNIQTKIYANAFNLTKKQIDLFVNCTEHERYSPISLNVLKANSSILGYNANRLIDGDTYCEGAVSDALNFTDLLENHPDLDEVWVLNILDYNQIKPPKNQLEADLLAIELPFITIAHDNIQRFSWHLKESGLNNSVKLIKIDMNYRELDFFWKQSTLKKGIQVGYEGAVQTINRYLHAACDAGKSDEIHLGYADNVRPYLLEELSRQHLVQPEAKDHLHRKGIRQAPEEFTNCFNELLNKLSEDQQVKTAYLLENKIKGAEKPSWQERRTHPRKVCAIETVYANKGKVYRDLIKNISAGGAFIETSNPLPIGQKISMAFSPSDFDKTLEISAIITRHDPTGIGVKFNKHDQTMDINQKCDAVAP